MSNEEQTNAYDIVLADLMARRDQLDAAIAAIQAAKGGTSGGTASNASGGAPQIRSDEFFGMTVLDGAKKFLAMMKRPQSSQTITDALTRGGYLFSAGNPVATVASVLNRDDGKGGDVVRTGKGMFGLASWYPNRSRRKKNNGDNDADQGDQSDQSESGDNVFDDPEESADKP